MTYLLDPRPLEPPSYWEDEPPPEPKHWHLTLPDGTEEWIPEDELEPALRHCIDQGILSFKLLAPI
jgi:hypothetical protein